MSDSESVRAAKALSREVKENPGPTETGALRRLTEQMELEAAHQGLAQHGE